MKYYFCATHDYTVVAEVSASQLANCIADLKRFGYKNAAVIMERLREDAKARAKSESDSRPVPLDVCEAVALAVAANATRDTAAVLSGLGERKGLFLQWAQGRNGLKLKRCCSECKRPL